MYAPAAPPRNRSRLAAAFPAALLATLVATTSACHDPVSTFGSSHASARRNADGLIGALAARYGPAENTPWRSKIRPQLLRHVFVPSGLHGDSSLWTGISGNRRTLEIAGASTARGYRLALDRRAPAPARMGEMRQVITLEHLDDGAYAWSSSEELAAGEIPPHGVANLVIGALRTIERTPSEGLRAGFRLAFPRTSAALARAFTLDSLESTPLHDGSSAVTMRISIHPERVREEFPALASYLERYSRPAEYRVQLAEYDGVRWLNAVANANTVTIRLRSRNGILVPLAGRPRALPDSLRIRLSFSAKVLFFRVGMKDLTGDLHFISTANERGWVLRFRDEPDWKFPFVVEHLIGGSLRRPFEGEGVTVALLARRSSAEGRRSATVLARDLSITVEDSEILRWLNRLAGVVVDDYTGDVEEEQMRFLGQAFSALRSETIALIEANRRLTLGR